MKSQSRAPSFTKKASGLLGIALAVSCGGSSPPVAAPPTPVHAASSAAEAPRITPDAPFRQEAPAADGKVQFVSPKIATAKLKNGLRVLVVERHDLPVVSARLVVSLGAGDLSEVRPGTPSFLGAMLDRGTKKRNALQISDGFEAIGAHHGTWVDWDSAGTSIRVLTDQLDAALELMADVSLAPTFPDAEVERVRSQRLTAIQSEKNSPPAIAQNVIAKALFGHAHPYGHNLSGEESDLKQITRAELSKAYDRLFAVRNAALVISGDVTLASLLPKLEARFGGWKPKPGAATRKPPKTPARADTDKRIVFVDRPGAAQSQVQIVRHGIPHAVKDREAFIVANAVLGGTFSSRINMNLREKHSYTYGARSHWAMRHGAGPFTAGGAIVSDKTGPAIKEVLSELEALRRDGPSEEELSLAKEHIRLAMPARFETTSEIASAVSDLVVYDLPLDDYEKRLARIDAVTAADVKRIAAEYFTADTMTIVVVGSKGTVAPQLEQLGLGALDERDPYGNPLTTASKN